MPAVLEGFRDCKMVAEASSCCKERDCREDATQVPLQKPAQARREMVLPSYQIVPKQGC